MLSAQAAWPAAQRARLGNAAPANKGRPAAAAAMAADGSRGIHMTGVRTKNPFREEGWVDPYATHKNDGFCIKCDEFCIKMMNFVSQ